MGKAAPGVDVKIIDDDANVLEPGKEGNIGVKITPFRPLGLFAGYLVSAEFIISCETASSRTANIYVCFVINIIVPSKG